MTDGEWFPIHEAPKDGTKILGCVEGMDDVLICFWGKESHYGTYGTWVWLTGWESETGDGKKVRPTHFTYLPHAYNDLKPKRTWLQIYRDRVVEESVNKGSKLFYGLPEEWLDDPRWACTAGHLSKRTLKLDSGDHVCLECREPVFLVPDVTQQSLQEIMRTINEEIMNGTAM